MALKSGLMPGICQCTTIRLSYTISVLTRHEVRFDDLLLEKGVVKACMPYRGPTSTPCLNRIEPHAHAWARVIIIIPSLDADDDQHKSVDFRSNDIAGMKNSGCNLHYVLEITSTLSCMRF